jgi:hypothetical protein
MNAGIEHGRLVPLEAQYKTDLNQPNWSNSGNVVTANQATLKATNVAGSDFKRFYRVLLQHP